MCCVIDNEDGRRCRYGWLIKAFHCLLQDGFADRRLCRARHHRHIGPLQGSSETDLQFSTAPVCDCDRRTGGRSNGSVECRLHFVFSCRGGDRGCGVGCTADDHGKCECALVSGCQNADPLRFAISRLSSRDCAC